MNFGEIFDSIKGPLIGVAAALIPGGPAVLAAVNAFLPDEKKLPSTATGNDIFSAVESLSPDQRSSLMEKKIDLEIAKEEGMTDRYKAMASSDGQECRAKIVNKAMNALVILTGIFVAAIGWVYVNHGAQKAFSAEMAAVFITVTGTFAFVVRAYFGDLRTEATSRHQTVDTKPAPMSAVAALVASRINK